VKANVEVERRAEPLCGTARPREVGPHSGLRIAQIRIKCAIRSSTYFRGAPMQQETPVLDKVIVVGCAVFVVLSIWSALSPVAEGGLPLPVMVAYMLSMIVRPIWCWATHERPTAGPSTSGLK